MTTHAPLTPGGHLRAVCASCSRAHRPATHVAGMPDDHESERLHSLPMRAACLPGAASAVHSATLLAFEAACNQHPRPPRRRPFGRRRGARPRGPASRGCPPWRASCRWRCLGLGSSRGRRWGPAAGARGCWVYGCSGVLSRMGPPQASTHTALHTPCLAACVRTTGCAGRPGAQL